jgi:biopolymer transport protein ExbD
VYLHHKCSKIYPQKLIDKIMAEINQNLGHGPKRLSTRIDMTPMVDLGFLLITFFMLTTTLQKPSEMALNMPDDSKVTEPYPASKTLALIPAANNMLYYFRGDPKNPSTKVGSTNYAVEGLRRIILENKRAVESIYSKSKFVVVVMPIDKATYKNVVDVLDELAITGSDRYGII